MAKEFCMEPRNFTSQIFGMWNSTCQILETNIETCANFKKCTYKIESKHSGCEDQITWQ